MEKLIVGVALAGALLLGLFFGVVAACQPPSTPAWASDVVERLTVTRYWAKSETTYALVFEEVTAEAGWVRGMQILGLLKTRTLEIGDEELVQTHEAVEYLGYRTVSGTDIRDYDAWLTVYRDVETGAVSWHLYGPDTLRVYWDGQPVDNWKGMDRLWMMQNVS